PPRSRNRQQMVVADEDAEIGRCREALFDPGVAPSTDLAVVEVRLCGVDGDDSDPADAHHGVAVAEELLEVDVADVPRVVVARDDDDRLAVDRVDVLLGEGVLLLEPEGRQIARDDDDFRLQVLDYYGVP